MKNLAMFDKMSFYAPGMLGKTRRETPEGFLVCEGVAIARTGQQLYSKSELPLDANPDGTIIIDRIPEEVFKEETIASFEGKPVTVEHPNEFVTPETWKKLSVGVVQNVRKGEGIDDEFLMADLLITDKKAIEYVNKSLPELSCGYDSDYEQPEAGRGIQRNIIGNHVALVERGRAGPRCAIKDHKPEETKMTKKASVLDRLMGVLSAVKNKDQKALDAIMTEDAEDEEGFGSMDSSKMKDTIDKCVKDAFDRCMRDWEDKHPHKDSKEEKKEEKKEENKDEKKTPNMSKEQHEYFEEKFGNQKHEDTVISPEVMKKNPEMLGRTWVGDSAAPIIKEIVSRAEILSPGIILPTTDSVSNQSVKNFIFASLSKAATTDKGKECMKPFLADRKLETLDGQQLMAVFTGAAELMRATNNLASRPGTKTKDDFGNAITPDSINEANRKFWAERKQA